MLNNYHKMEEEKLGEVLMKNSPVEVRSEEEGFGDAWFEATIITPPSNNNKVFVQYKTLFVDESFSSLLRERVHVRFVRPVPPMYNNPTLFELYDVVDAFYNDGWWRGVITRVHQNSTFLVTFQDPPDEILFEASSLRLHYDWVDHKWVRPRKQKIHALMFREGKSVEVLVKIKDVQDVWYPAIIVENHADMTFLVEYVTLKEGTKKTESQIVTVGHSYIRPRPPPLKSVLFHLSEKVDALNEFGWWSGVITKAHPDNRYSVSFQIMERNMEFDRTAIRLELNWRNGKWWCASSQEEVPCQNHEGLAGIELNEISFGKTCGDQPSCNPSRELRTKKKAEKDNHVLCSRRNPGQVGEDCDNGFTKLANPVEKSSGVNKADTSFISGLKTCKFSGGKAGKSCPTNDEKCPKFEVQPNDLPVQDKGDQSEDGKSSHKRKRGRPREVCEASENAEVTENSLMPIGNSMTPVYATLERGNDTDSTPIKSCLRLPTDNNDQALISEHEERIPEKAKRRTTSEENIVQISDGTLAGNNHFISIDSSDGTVAKTTEPFCMTKIGIRTVQQKPGMFDDHPTEVFFQDPTLRMQSHGTVNSSRASAASIMEQSTELRQTRKEPHGQTACEKVDEITAVMSDAVDAQNSVLVDGDTMVEQSAELRLARKELFGLTTSGRDNNSATIMSEEVDAESLVLVDGNASITTTGDPELPFEKSSSLWTVLESMEAFRKMPQKPHFRPLQQHKKSVCESDAITYMVTFVTVVERISRLSFDDMKEKIVAILDTLNDLESHGFGVQVLRDRITELESLAEKHKKLLAEVDVINKQIFSCNLDKADQEKEISEATNRIKKLQETIAKAESIKEIKDGEIAELESKRHEAEESILSARSCCERLTSGIC